MDTDRGRGLIRNELTERLGAQAQELAHVGFLVSFVNNLAVAYIRMQPAVEDPHLRGPVFSRFIESLNRWTAEAEEAGAHVEAMEDATPSFEELIAQLVRSGHFGPWGR